MIRERCQPPAAALGLLAWEWGGRGWERRSGARRQNVGHAQARVGEGYSGEGGLAGSSLPSSAYLLQEVAASRVEPGVAKRDPGHVLAVRCSCGRGGHEGSSQGSLVGPGQPFVALQIDAVGAPQHEVNP
eukprot:scaffold12543_cov115-Isochrysis_galbana.AAC.5